MPNPPHSQDDYHLLDSGNARKLEQFGRYVLERPCSQAVWSPQHPARWEHANAVFDRRGGLRWKGREKLPETWQITTEGIRLKLSTTDFGHIGLFPETRELWRWIARAIREAAGTRECPPAFLNLFAYSGGATLAAASVGAACCHLDASRGMVDWARENAALNNLETAPVRWIVDDAHKFLKREANRASRYDLVLLDPPSFGRGRKGELYKIETDLPQTLNLVKAVLSDRPLGVILTAHTPGFTPLVLHNLLRQTFGPGDIRHDELVLRAPPPAFPLPSGAWARWSPPATPPPVP